MPHGPTRTPPIGDDDAWAARVTRAVHAGSRDALGEIYDRCAEPVVDFVMRATARDESFALDCLQEMFMRLAAHPPIADSMQELLAWMRVASLNVARNRIVSEERRTRRERGVARARPEAVAAETSVAEAGVADDARDLERILAHIGADELALARLRHVEGLRIAAIARAVGATPRAVESALRRLVTRLRTGVER